MAPKRPAGQAAATQNQFNKRARIQRGRQIHAGGGSNQVSARKGAAGKGGAKARPDPLGAANEAALRTVKSKMKDGMPPAVQVEKFALARSFEINSMKKAMKNAWESSTKRAFQTLPRHLRRRAASHNARRVPSRLRAKAASEIDPKTKKKQHFPRKKVTRKTGLSLTERYRRRQRDKIWLDTHIWMAKRMHMVNVWGFRLAHRPTAKAFRPSHRAAIRSSILSDVSHYSLLELKGPAPVLREVLKQICGEVCWGARFEDGARMAATTLYRVGEWPQGFLTPAQVLWRPDEGAATSIAKSAPTRQLWMRFHPSSHASVFSTIRASISLALSKQRSAPSLSKHQADDVKVELNDVRDEVCVFEVVGPKGGKVLRGALGDLVKEETREETKAIWKELSDIATPGSIPSGMVMGFKTYNPRLSFPPKNVQLSAKALDSGTPSFAHLPSATLAGSELWNSGVRKGLAKKKFKKVELDARRAELGLPGARLRPEVDDARLPLLLIQQTVSPETSSSLPVASAPTSAMHGYLLFHPRGWSQPLLHSLVFTGTRVGGIREAEARGFESGAGSWPRDFVASEQSSLWWKEKAKEDKLKWDRKPPAKRANYLKLGWEDVDLNTAPGRTPWKPDWAGVLDGYSSDVVMQDEEATLNGEPSSTPSKPYLLQLHFLLDLIPALLDSSDPATTLLAAVNEQRSKRGLAPIDKKLGYALFGRAIVRVSVDSLSRGVAGEVGPIFALAEDAEGLAEERLWRAAYSAGRKGRDVDHDAEASVVTPPRSSIVGYLTNGAFSLARGHGFALGGMPLKAVLALYKKDLAAGRLAVVSHHGQQSLKVKAGELIGLVKIRKREGGVPRAGLVRLAQ